MSKGFSKNRFVDSPEMAYDPRSAYYKRINNRPKINFIYVILNLVMTLGFSSFIATLFYIRYEEKNVAHLVLILLVVLQILLRFKGFIISFVEIYQRFAPESLRNECRFEPSCSNYMIKAVNKYGVVKGFAKGVCRCFRCNPMNGGFDEP